MCVYVFVQIIFVIINNVKRKVKKSRLFSIVFVYCLFDEGLRLRYSTYTKTFNLHL